MKIKLYKSVALCSLLALAGCHDFEELNTNPYAPIYDPTVENVSADGTCHGKFERDGRCYRKYFCQLHLRRSLQ